MIVDPFIDKFLIKTVSLLDSLIWADPIFLLLNFNEKNYFYLVNCCVSLTLGCLYGLVSR